MIDKSACIKFIEKDELEEALFLLKESPNPLIREKAILCLARLNELAKNSRDGLISPSDASVQRNAIRTATLSLALDPDEEKRQEIPKLEQDTKTIQIHNGKGDNIAGDKITGNGPKAFWKRR